MSDSIKFIKSEYSSVSMFKPIELHTFSHLSMSYLGSKIPSFPYSFTIEIRNTIVNYENEVIMDVTIDSEFELYKIAPIEAMYKAHLTTIQDLENHLNRIGGNTFLKTYKVPIPPINEVKQSIIDADLFDRLVTGLRMN